MAREPINRKQKAQPPAAPSAPETKPGGLVEDEPPPSVLVPPPPSSSDAVAKHAEAAATLPAPAPSAAPERPAERVLSIGEAWVRIVHGSVSRHGKTHERGERLVVSEREAERLVKAGACVRE